jgi:hypothetical protein
VRAPTGAQPHAVARYGNTAAGGRVLTADHVVRVPLDHVEPGVATRWSSQRVRDKEGPEAEGGEA